VIARFAVLALMVLGLGSAGAVSPVSGPRLVADEETPDAAPVECTGELQTGPSLDDPNVDTDPERPIMEHTSMVTGEGEEDGDGGQNDDGADGQCRSETLELWHQNDPNALVHAMLETHLTNS
jgi:hypothetical protein